MEYPKEQINALKRYCAKLSALVEAGTTFLFLEGLRLPAGCDPRVCDGLLCPVARDGYPSRLYFSALVASPYRRNWNVSNARIGEKNWFAFSWKVDSPDSTLEKILVAHLAGFATEK
jgi:hypothetical protein